MKLKSNLALLVINIATILLLLVITFFSNVVLRVILGLPLVLFFPGYVLLAALFYRKNSMDTVERTALSFVLSIAVVPIIGLILNYTTWGITVYSTLVSLSVFILVISVIAWFRQRKLTNENKTAVNIDLSEWGKRKLGSRIISIILIAVIIITIGILGYTIATPKTGEPFTEFYILGADGAVADYPADINPGASGHVILGIINHEQKIIEYRVEINVDGTLNGTFGPVTLLPEDKSENEVSFTPLKAGDNQQVEFVLYKDSQSYPYLNLHLWVNVK